MERWFIPYATSALPAAQRVLVIAPHPDDEIFGCGGAIALYRQRETQVQVLVLTDGVALSSDAERQQLAATRVAETQKALAVLGVADVQFWALEDRSLVHHEDLRQRLHQAMCGMDLVIAPSYAEIHPDHAAAGYAVCDAIRQWSDKNGAAPNLLLYEVGALLQPNFLLDISSVWALKWQAMQCFDSQLKLQNYARHIEGLNTYRTYTLGRQITHAEAYRRLSLADLPDELSMAHERTRGDFVNTLKLAEVEAERSLKDWRAQRNALLANLDELREVKLSQDREIEKLILALQDASVFGETKEREILDLQNAVRSFQTNLEACEQNRRQLENSNAHLTSNIRQLSDELGALLTSRSWRWTRPLRWLSQWLAGRATR